MERLVELCSDEGTLVLDCFLGSGSTAVACRNTNRNFVGCELYEEYYKICLERLKSKTDSGAVRSWEPSPHGANPHKRFYLLKLWAAF